MKVTKERKAGRRDTKEMMKPVEDRTVRKRRAAIKEDKSTKKTAKKKITAKKDPNKPKRPASAFFVFLLGRLGEKSRSRCLKLRKLHMKLKAAKRKSQRTEYEKLMTTYNNKQDSVVDDDEEESD